MPREKRKCKAQKHKHNKYIDALLAALERCCDCILIVEKAFSVVDPILAITKITDGSFVYGNTIWYNYSAVQIVNIRYSE
jgi:hypothetical protein